MVSLPGPRSPKPHSRVRQIASFLRHPDWLYRALVRKDLEMVNITSNSAFKAQIDRSIRDFIDAELERSLTWRDVEWLAERWPGPLVIKGVQTVEDCRKAADAGATAVMLSNHGGRQLESAPAPVDCVAAVADALRDRLEIICDGGFAAAITSSKRWRSAPMPSAWDGPTSTAWGREARRACCGRSRFLRTSSNERLR